MDRKNEKQIQETIDKISSEHTSLTIAHRLATIKNSDKILVLKNGEIIEQGIHDDLITNDQGIYKKLVEGQILDLERDEDFYLENAEELVSKRKLSNRELENQLSLQQSEELISDQPPLPKLKSFVGHEKYWMIPAFLVSVLKGSIMPLFGYVLAKVIGVLVKFALIDNPDYDQL